MRIEKPRYIHKDFVFDEWFDREVEPVNKMLKGAVEVSGFGDAPNWTWKQDIENLSYAGRPEYRALLINIEPIKKETAEDVLRDWLGKANSRGLIDWTELKTRAERVLEAK